MISYTLLVVMGNVSNTLENCLLVLYKNKHMITVKFSNFILGHLSWEMNLCSHRNLYTNVNSKFIIIAPSQK